MALSREWLKARNKRNLDNSQDWDRRIDSSEGPDGLTGQVMRRLLYPLLTYLTDELCNGTTTTIHLFNEESKIRRWGVLNSQGKENGHLAANGDLPGTLATTLRGFSINLNQRRNNYFWEGDLLRKEGLGADSMTGGRIVSRGEKSSSPPGALRRAWTETGLTMRERIEWLQILKRKINLTNWGAKEKEIPGCGIRTPGYGVDWIRGYRVLRSQTQGKRQWPLLRPLSGLQPIESISP